MGFVARRLLRLIAVVEASTQGETVTNMARDGKEHTMVRTLIARYGLIVFTALPAACASEDNSDPTPASIPDPDTRELITWDETYRVSIMLGRDFYAYPSIFGGKAYAQTELSDGGIRFRLHHSSQRGYSCGLTNTKGTLEHGFGRNINGSVVALGTGTESSAVDWEAGDVFEVTVNDSKVVLRHNDSIVGMAPLEGDRTWAICQFEKWGAFAGRVKRVAPTIVEPIDNTECRAIGYEQTPTMMTLPSGYAPGTFNWALSEFADCYDGDIYPEFRSMDITGDNATDLVVTSACDETVGTSSWRVYRGSAEGFAEPYLEWTLPTGYGPEAFRTTTYDYKECDEDYDLNIPAFRTIDMNGDRMPDLVITQTCANPDSHWLVHLNTGAGFNTEAIKWPVPAGNDYGPDAFGYHDPYRDCNDADNRPEWVLSDMDGDNLTDIVVSTSCTDFDTGKSHWLVYRNTGEGFAAQSTVWPLPAGNSTGAFEIYSDPPSADCDSEDGTARPEYYTEDIDGDKKPDMVITTSCHDANVGNTHWLVHRNTGTGFSQVGDVWPLPPHYAEFAFRFPGLFIEGNCNSSGDLPSYLRWDMDGDKRPDIMISRSCDEDVGVSKFLVYRNEGDGFAETAIDWALPAGYSYIDVGAPGSNYCDDGEDTPPRFDIASVNSDNLQSLLITRVCGDEAVGTQHWLRYAPLCAAE